MNDTRESKTEGKPSVFKAILTRMPMALWLMVVGMILFLNLRLYSESPLAKTVDETPPDMIGLLASNRRALNDGLAPRMQTLFPEGYFFCYLFHGLTWVELGMRDHDYAKEAIEEAIWCMSKIDSPEGREPFPAKLPPDHGMFFSAWKCLLRAGVVQLQEASDPEQVDALRQECDAIADALGDAETPFLPSYYGSAWPCDAVPAVHALCSYDCIMNEPRYAGLVASWLRAARERLDPETGLLPHTSSIPDGRTGSMARATSQVIILRLLPDIDPQFAKQQYEVFRQNFFTTFIGIPCLLEYPDEIAGPGDIDSGPLIFGRSLSATVLMMGVAQVYGDFALANAIAQAGETVGMPSTSENAKRYMWGALPIGDIFVAYAHVARPWYAGTEHWPDAAYAVSPTWRLPVHALSCLVLLPVVPILIRRYRRKVATQE